MPGLRTITAVDDLPPEVAVVLTRHPDTGDEVWQINRTAPIGQIVDECNDVFRHMADQCAELRARGRRRALWLLCAAVVGLVLPSPFRALYGTHRELLAVLDPIAIVAVGGLLLAALREHAHMRHIMADD